MLQDEVPAAELGTVNGVQGSVCAAFEMASFVAGLALRTPREFSVLMAGSVVVVAVSAFLLTHFALTSRIALRASLPGAAAEEAHASVAVAKVVPSAARELQPLAPLAEHEDEPLLSASSRTTEPLLSAYK